MANTQDMIPIEDIQDGIIYLKDGGAAVIIQTSAVNFGLLSAEEQIAIIGSFAQMINSLSFPIQLTILSKRLDISAYLKLLEKAQMNQTNPLLAQMMIRYRRFIQSLIKDNEVLDKQFYITVPLSSLEIGVGVRNKEEKHKKTKTILDPKRDQIIRQLNRVGLTAKQLKDQQIIKLFFEIYNSEEGETTASPTPSTVNLSTPKPPTPPPATAPSPIPPIPQPLASPSPVAPIAPPPQPILQAAPAPPAPIPVATQPPQPVAPPAAPTPVEKPRSAHPFVVEELNP
jgi:hypothetical protein